MNFIYDVLLNFNDGRIYDFYEWGEKDDIEYFKKVPVFKINNETYRKILVGNIIASDAILDKMHCNSEVYDQKMIRQVEYVCIFTNGYEAKGVLLNKRGQILMLSKLLIDEEEEVLDIVEMNDDIKLEIKVQNEASKGNNFLTRSESYKMFFLNKEIDSLYAYKKINKLKYLYYECFNQMEEEIDITYKKLKEFLNDNWSDKHENLYNLIRLSYSKNNK